MLPWSSKVPGECTTAALRFWVGSVMEARLKSTSAIDDWSTSCCQSTLGASKCDHLDGTMLLLAFLASSSIFFVQAIIGIVDCIFCHLSVAVFLCPIPFPFAECIECLFYFCLNRMEQNRTVTVFFWLLLCHRFGLLSACAYTCKSES